MAQLEPDLPRFRALFVLERLPARVRSDVLADGSIASLFDFTMKRPALLTDQIVLLRDELFAAFRSASDAPTVHQFHDERDALVDATTSVNADGSGTIEIATTKVRIPWITLLSPNVENRLSQLEICLARYPLSQTDADSLRALIERPDYSDEDFLNVAAMLESSPEAFAQRLDEKLRRQGQKHRIGPEDVLPEDVRYWNHLIAPVDDSLTLAEYIGKELHDLWCGRLAKDPRDTFHAMATTFAAPALVPHALLKSLDAETAAAIIEFVANVDDHFSLAGAFEICADRVAEDQKFVNLGEHLLDRLFGDMGRLTGTCALFGAIFVIATAYLAEHETLQRRPVYWRRLAATAHAARVVRLCGNGGINADEIIAWAMRVSGETYYLSVVSDFVAEPQWRPEWIIPKILVADVFGRALGAFDRMLREAAPPSWKERIEKAYVFIRDEHIGPFTRYPAVLEGTPRPNQPTLAEFKTGHFDAAVDAYQDLANDPSADRLLSISPFIEAFGFPKEATGDVVKVLNSIRMAVPSADDNSISLALTVIAHIAILTGNTALADSVSEVCLERARGIGKSRWIFEIVARLVECVAAIQDRDEARRTLARRLEILAFIMLASDEMARLASAIETLKRVQPELASLLGRALAAARLGIPHSTAA